MTDDVQVKFGASINGLLDGVAESKEAIEGLSEYVNSIGKSFTELAEAIGVAFAVDKIGEFENKFAELGEQIDRTAKITGESTAGVQEFSLATKLAGGDAGTAAQTLNILQKNIGEAISKAGTARSAFEGMGIGLQQLKSTDVVTLLFQMKQRLDEAGSSAEQSALKQEYLRAVAGRSAAQFLALGMSLDEVKKVAAETGYIMSPQVVGNAKQLSDSTHTLDAAWIALSNSLGNKVAPAYERSIGLLTRIIEKTNELITANDNLSASDKPYDPSGMLKNYDHVVPDGPKGRQLGEGQFGPNRPAKPLKHFGSGDGSSSSDARDQEERLSTDTQISLSHLAFEQISQDQNALVALSKETEAQKIEAIKASAELLEQTEQGLLDKEAAGYAQDSLAYQQVQAKKAVLAAQFNLEVSKLNEQLAAAQKKQYEQELAPWKQLTSDMGGAFDTMINGVLSGTQTWKQALAKSYDDLGIKFAEVMTKMTAEYLTFQATSGKGLLGFGTSNPFAALSGPAATGAASAVGGNAGNAATQALTTAITGNTATTVQNTGGILQQFSSMIQSVAQTLGLTTATTAQATATAASTAATTTAAAATTGLIPSIAANIAALAANTTALIASKAIPGFAVGSWSVPSDMTANIHAGEMIIPAGPAAAIRAGTAALGGNGGSGAGAGNFTININAIDTQTGAQFLKNNASVIANTLSGQMRNFNPNMRPA